MKRRETPQQGTNMPEKLNIRVRLISGQEEKPFNEPPSTSMAQLREECFKKFKLSPAPGQRWIFKPANGQPIENDSTTLAQAGVKDKDLLLFGSEADILG